MGTGAGSREIRRTLADALAPGGPAHDDRSGQGGELLRTVAAVVTALEEWHARSGPHGMLRPAAVELMPSGAARILPPVVGQGRREELLTYRSPERFVDHDAPATVSGDLYALGVMLYQLVAGRSPFDAQDALGLQHAHLAMTPPSLHTVRPDAPAALVSVVDRLLAKQPEDRYPDAAAVRRDLESRRPTFRPAGSPGSRHGPPRPSMTLHGRDQESGAVHAALDRLTRGPGRGTAPWHAGPTVLTVEGPPGMGKSMLAEDVVNKVRRRGGLVGYGAFDERYRELPYATLPEMVAGVVDGVLASHDADAVRDELLATLGPSAGLVTSAAPPLERLVGPQPMLARDGAQVQGRFLGAMERLVAVLSRRMPPLVLVFDDVQWADPASLALLGRALSAPDVRDLVLMLVHRDEASARAVVDGLVDQAGPDAVLVRLTLGPLDRRAVRDLVADAVDRPAAEVDDLAELVYTASAGSPLVAVGVLTDLYTEGDLRFDESAQSWSWNLRRRTTKGLPPRGGGLTTEHMARLPSDSREVLEVASLVRGEAPLKVLARISGLTPEETLRALEPAVERNLVATDGRVVRFHHDVVRQEAARLPAPRRRDAIRLSIARALRGTSEDSDDRLFDIVEQFAATGHVPRARSERLEIVRLFLTAGRRAQTSGAFTASARYLDEALLRVRGNDWRDAHELALDVHLARAETAFALHDIAGAATLGELCRRRARTLSQAAAAARLVISVHHMNGRVTDAVQVGLRTARRFGVDLPLRPGRAAASTAYWSAHQRLAGLTADQLAALPVCTDEWVLASMEVLHSFTIQAPLVDPNLHDLVVATMVDLTLRHGLTPQSAFAVTFLGMLACSRHEEYAEGSRIAQMGHRLSLRPMSVNDQPVIETLLATALLLSSDPAEALPHLGESVDLARALGNPPIACYALCFEARVLLGTERSLDEVAQHVEQAARYCARVGYSLIADYANSLAWFVGRLRGQHEPRPDGHDAVAEAIAVRTAAARVPAVSWRHEILRTWLLLVEGDHEGALEAAQRAQAQQQEQALVDATDLVVYRALAAARAADGASGPVRDGYLAEVTQALSRVHRWAEAGPHRFGAMAALLEAESARLAGDEAAATNGYEEAIRLARKNGQLVIRALAAEAAARCHAAAGRDVMAHGYRRAARASYAQWGARRKVRLMESEESSPLGPADHGEAVDLLAVVRASQAISEVVEFDELVDRLLRTTVQRSGADYAALLLAREGRLELCAEAVVPAQAQRIEVRSYPPGTTSEAGLLPQEVLRAAEETRRPVQLDGPEAQGVGRPGGPHMRPAPRSLLCLPMLREGALHGLLYLENRLLPHAFAGAGRTVLEVLAAQAAISVENAVTRQALRSSEERYRKLVEAAPDAIVSADAQGRIVLVNSQAELLFGYSRQELVGRPVSSLLVTVPASETAWPRPSSLAFPSVLLGRGEAMHRTGERFPIETSRSTTGTAAERLETMIVRDVSERQRFEEQLRYLADHDTLTGLFNRHRFESELELEVARDRRYRSQGSLLVLDLDNFKDINDVLGHHAGDEVLRVVAAVLRDRTRESDIVARLGGDEFAVLLPETSAAEAGRLAQDLLASLARVRVPLAARQTAVTASAGVAEVGSVGGTATDVLAAADMALYDAKESGRNRVATYDVARLSDTRQRLTWADRLRDALENGGLLVYQQPILDLRTNAVTRCELLLRMRGDVPGRVVPPSSFLPVAERIGLINRIDRWVIEQAVPLLSRGALGDLAAAVNLSAPSLGDPELPDAVERLLAEHPEVDPSRLTFEITETTLIANIEEAAALARRLRSLGCGLALDDFGAGFGSFYYLKHLPLDVVKLDGDFVRALRDNPTDRLVIDAMVTIAGGLGLRTVAEHVPDEPTCRWLAEHGVDYAQGYWVGKPVPTSLPPA